jgi:hypothetical protein
LGKSETSQKLLKTEMRVVGQFEFPKLADAEGRLSGGRRHESDIGD